MPKRHKDIPQPFLRRYAGWIAAGGAAATLTGAAMIAEHIGAPSADPKPTATNLPQRGDIFTPTLVRASATPPERARATATAETPVLTPQEFVARLENIFGFPPTISRDDLAKRLYPLVFENPLWSTNTHLGKLKNRYGEIITIETNYIGDPASDKGNRFSVDYPTTPDVKKAILSTGVNHIVVYGTQETVDNFERLFRESQLRQSAQRFIAEYFRGINTQMNILHLNFSDKAPVKYIGVGNGEIARLDALDVDEGAIASTGFIRGSNIKGGKEVPIRLDVRILMRINHEHALNIGISTLEQQLNSTLGNEAGNFLASYLYDRSIRIQINEAPTTILGLLAEHDDRWTRLALGGDAYKAFLPYVAQEMERIGKVRS